MKTVCLRVDRWPDERNKARAEAQKTPAHELEGDRLTD